MAENFMTCNVSSNMDAHMLTLTIIEARPLPQKNPWNKRVSLLSRNGMINGWFLPKKSKVLLEWDNRYFPVIVFFIALDFGRTQY